MGNTESHPQNLHNGRKSSNNFKNTQHPPQSHQPSHQQSRKQPHQQPHQQQHQQQHQPSHQQQHQQPHQQQRQPSRQQQRQPSHKQYMKQPQQQYMKQQQQQYVQQPQQQYVLQPQQQYVHPQQQYQQPQQQQYVQPPQQQYVLQPQQQYVHPQQQYQQPQQQQYVQPQQQLYVQQQQQQYVQQPQQQYVQQQQYIGEPSLAQQQQIILQNQYQHIQEVNNKQLTRQFEFSGIDILNVNDKIKGFEENQRQRQEEFEQEQEMRRKLFEKEIKIFEQSRDDPYKILGLDANNISIDKIKKAYKIKAQRNHPDRGGNPEVFKKITQSYCYLTSKYGQADEMNKKIKQEVVNKKYDNKLLDGYENVHISKDNFNINKFNDIFEKFKMDNSYDDGYGDIMTNDPRTDEEIDVDKSIFNNQSFNIDVFNQTFGNDNTNDELMVYQEPEALPSSGDSYQILGQSKISDFGKSDGNMKFTDYKRAYSNDNKFINPENVKYKQYKNVNELKAERSNITHKMSEQEERLLKERQRREEEMEQKRQKRVKKEDDKYLDQFEKINKLFIKDY
jgi:hypothetical protein